MAFNFSPRVVTDGLILYLDAANINSYVSGSTVWRDLTINSNNGTLINGPVYNSNNAGSISFDGVDDYVQIPSSSMFNIPSITIDCSFYMKTWTGYGALISNGYHDSPGPTIYGYSLHIRPNYDIWMEINNNNSRLDITSPIGMTENSFNHVSVSVGSSGCKIYNKGIQRYSDSNNYNIVYNGIPNSGTVVPNIWIGALHYIGPRNLNGNISSLKLYNRALSAGEVLQNYNALKSRFNLT